jgi:hypothetical protein
VINDYRKFIFYYRKFIDKYADRSAPLYDLLKFGRGDGKTRIEWSPAAGACFSDMKQVLVLKAFNPELKTE